MTRRLDPAVRAARLEARRRKSVITVDGDVAYVELTQGLVSAIDAADVEVASGFGWCATKRADGKAYYVCAHPFGPDRKSVPGNIFLHRVIMRAPDGLVVDHIDGDGLNNRRSNLRVVTQAQNAKNQIARMGGSSPFKGVCFYKNRWVASITCDYKSHYLGRFRTEEAAYAAYCDAAARLHGEFRRTA